jgi:hypothetical protein
VIPATSAARTGAVQGVGSMTPMLDIAPAGSLLPEPTMPVGSIESILELMATFADERSKSSKTDVERKFNEKKAALDEYQKQMEKAEEEADSTFGDLAKVGMIVAAAAATVCSFGTAGAVLVAVAVGLSTTGYAVSETKCLDGLLGDGASAWVGAGLGLAGAVLTMCGPGGVDAAMRVAEIAQSGAAIAKGCQQVNNAVVQNRCDEAMIDAQAAQNQMSRIDRAIQDVITLLQDDKDDTRRVGDHVNETIQTKDQTLLIAAGGRA